MRSSACWLRFIEGWRPFRRFFLRNFGQGGFGEQQDARNRDGILQCEQDLGRIDDARLHMGTFLPALAGCALFLLMEQFLAWHHSHSMTMAVKQPVDNLVHFTAFVADVVVILGTRLAFEG